MASPSSENGAESAHPIRQTLALEALDAEGLWTALGSVEKALPHLLLCLKPILARLTSQPGESLTKVNPLTQSIGLGEDGAGVGEEAALRAIKDYMAILDDIQYVLRQTTFYLKATRSSPSTLKPPPPNSIPTPFASTLASGPAFTSSSSGPSSSTPGMGQVDRDENGTGDSQSSSTLLDRPDPLDHTGQAELGLYASRIELQTLKKLREGMKMMKEIHGERRERQMGVREGGEDADSKTGTGDAVDNAEKEDDEEDMEEV